MRPESFIARETLPCATGSVIPRRSENKALTGSNAVLESIPTSTRGSLPIRYRIFSKQRLEAGGVDVCDCLLKILFSNGVSSSEFVIEESLQRRI